MKVNGWLLKTLLCLMISCAAHAGWEVSTPQSGAMHDPFFQSVNQQNSAMSQMTYSGHTNIPNQYTSLGQPAPVYAVSISGSLKENIERIMDRYHWRVIWKTSDDYNFDGKITGTSLPNVIEKLLQPFPLQGVMYMSNRTLIITPRPRYRI